MSESESPLSPDPDTELIEARLDSISVTNVGFILFLKGEEEARENRVLPIFVGANEAQAIALALNEESPPRPLTHDLMKSMLDSLEVSVTRVEISEIRDGTFYGKVFLNKAGIEELEYDARPSDAIALALRWDAPIFVNRKVFDAAAVAMVAKDAVSGEAEDLAPAAETVLTPAQKLQEELQAALGAERYEEAARLRDAIKRLQAGN